MSRVQHCTLLLLLTFAIINESVAENAVLNIPRASKFFRESCKCMDQFNCQCCGGESFLKQKLCFNWTIAADWEIRSAISVNGVTLLTKTCAFHMIPPICIPVMPPIALFACMQIHSVAVHSNDTLHACANVSFRLLTIDLIETILGCVDISEKGIEIVSPKYGEMSTSPIKELPRLRISASDKIDDPTKAPHTLVILKNIFKSLKSKIENKK